MIEEVEHPNEKVKACCEICALYSAWWFQQKLFVLLLHFPAMMFYDPCYPSLFLCGWDYYYIDGVEQASNSSLVNTKYVTNRAVAMHLSCTGMYIQTIYLHVCIIEHVAINMYFIYREWFKQSCLSSRQISSYDDSILQSLLKLLDDSIQIIASRYRP